MNARSTETSRHILQVPIGNNTANVKTSKVEATIGTLSSEQMWCMVMGVSKNIVTDLLEALLGSSPVGTFKGMSQATTLWKCFLYVRAWTVAIQRMRGDVT
jgi:hypothetical protein